MDQEEAILAVAVMRLSCSRIHDRFGLQEADIRAKMWEIIRAQEKAPPTGTPEEGRVAKSPAD